MNSLLGQMNNNPQFGGYYFFASNDKAVSVWNIYFHRGGVFRSDTDILKILAGVFRHLSNDYNAGIVEHVLQSLETGNGIDEACLDDSSSGQLRRLHPLISENRQNSVKDLYHSDGPFYFKYLREFDDNFVRVLTDYREASAVKTSSVLDIGTGLGILPYMYLQNGHSVKTLDIADVPKEFGLVRAILGLQDHTEFTIVKYEAMVRFDVRFDIITCSQICFNNYADDDCWRSDEWRFFLKDLHDNLLTEDGFVWLGFNHFNQEVDGRILELRYQDIHDLFEPYMDPDATYKAARLHKSDIADLLQLH